ncbi:MAG: RecX family transcriptional regulator [Anaerolineae bacterium]|jgi:regulatory protein|nr:RecX family transcriptional regulator [Anaerolineae bacterium]
MGVITALEIQKRNQERVNVFIDQEFAFSLNLLEAARLRKGQTLSEPEIASLRADDAVVKAYESAIRFLAHRPRSTAEVRRNLESKSIDDPEIEQVIARLTANRYLDDEAFARFWVENRLNFKPLGHTALRYELRQKGIADTLIDTILSELDLTESAYRAAKSQIRRLKGLDARTLRNKLGNFLKRRGFSYAVIEDVILRLQDEDDVDR